MFTQSCREKDIFVDIIFSTTVLLNIPYPILFSPQKIVDVASIENKEKMYIVA